MSQGCLDLRDIFPGSEGKYGQETLPEMKAVQTSIWRFSKKCSQAAKRDVWRGNLKEERGWPGISGRSGFGVYVKDEVKGCMALSGHCRWFTKALEIHWGRGWRQGRGKNWGPCLLLELPEGMPSHAKKLVHYSEDKTHTSDFPSEDE